MNLETDIPAAAAATRNRVNQALASARDRTQDAVARGEQCVRESPRTAVVSAFVAGLAIGAIVAIASRPAPRRPKLAESLGDSRERLSELFGNVAAQLRDPIRKQASAVSDKASALLGDALEGALEKVPKRLRWW